jgi:hypothetical protein
MAFGIPGSDNGTASDGPFLGRMQFDARTGFFTTVDRIQGADGNWADKATQPFQNPAFAADFGSFQVGYIKFASPPAFLLVPLGQPIPQQPEEMSIAKPGERPRKAFLPGFRIKVMGKVFGDGEPRYFAGTSKALLTAMEDLHTAFLAAPDSRSGQIPLVAVTGTRTIETVSPRGTTKNYAPIFAITGWIARPEGFGERTVPAPSSLVAAPPRAAPAPVAAPAPARVEELEPLPF